MTYVPLRLLVGSKKLIRKLVMNLYYYKKIRILNSSEEKYSYSWVQFVPYPNPIR
jgi:hypothetical protein